MKFGKLKIVYCTFAAVLASLVLTCVPYGPPDGGDYDYDFDFNFTDVEYSSDGRSVTIYLDGSAPVRHSRSLTRSLAILGHDLFEVAFYHPGTNPPGTSTLRRAVWETGHAAGVSGVARDVDYASPYSSGAGLTGNNGAAVLFVGKKSDRTLLGVGRVRGTDDGGPLSTTITANTKAVTFEVAALEAGVSTNKDATSFLTAALGTTHQNPTIGNTEVFPVMIVRQLFPLFRINTPPVVANQTVYAQYSFNTYGNTMSIPLGDYRNAIIQKAAPELVTMSPYSYRLNPRYPRGGGTGQWAEAPDEIKDGSTGVSFRGNSLGNARNGLPFQNPVYLQFASLGSNDGLIFAFTFEIPVIPLSVDGGRDSDFSWYLRTGYDSYIYDLDDGKGGTGGAILIGTGNIEDVLKYNLQIRPPIKNIYPDPTTGYTFDLYGIQVNLRAGNDKVNYIVENLLSIPPETENKKVTFYLGGKSDEGGIEIDMDENIQTILTAHPEFINNGMVEVYVEYWDPLTQEVGDDPYFGTFIIYINTVEGTPDSDGIPPGNRYIIASKLDLYTFSHAVGASGGGNFIAVFFDSFDLQEINLNGGPYNIIILAANPDVTIGRASANGVFINWSTNTFYFGVWPFNDTLVVQGKAITSHSFTIHAAGTIANQILHGTGPTSGYFMANNNHLPMNIFGLAGLVVENDNRFIEE